MRRTRRILSGAAGACVVASWASAEEPLSAIDWLETPSAQVIVQPPADASRATEPPVTQTGQTPDVEVTPLGEATPDSVGLLPTATTGLPRSIWRASSSARLIDALAQVRPDTLPAAQALIYTLLLAEADAPLGAGRNAAFLKARVETLMRFGAVEPARALLERAGPTRRHLFDLWLDLALLSGDEDKACASLRTQPGLSRDYAARIFCTARAGDWPTAALTFDTATAIGAIPEPTRDLLAQFLDPEMIDDTGTLTPPSAPDPLTFRLYEAVGMPLPTRGLPRAFAMADLRGTSGWKAELEAAERLTRTGALPATRLLGLYTDRSPAASGGIWDRVRAMQSFDSALFRRDPDAIAEALPDAWSAARSEGLAVAFATLFGQSLMEVTLPEHVRPLAFRVALLSAEYERAVAHFAPHTAPEDMVLAAIARGQVQAATAESGWEAAILEGLGAEQASERHQGLLDEGKLGEAILTSALELGRAGPGNPLDATEALRTLRAVGLEDTARRAALQMIILGPPE